MGVSGSCNRICDVSGVIDEALSCLCTDVLGICSGDLNLMARSCICAVGDGGGGIGGAAVGGGEIGGPGNGGGGGGGGALDGIVGMISFLLFSLPEFSSIMISCERFLFIEPISLFSRHSWGC